MTFCPRQPQFLTGNAGEGGGQWKFLLGSKHAPHATSVLYDQAFQICDLDLRGQPEQTGWMEVGAGGQLKGWHLAVQNLSWKFVGYR